MKGEISMLNTKQYGEVNHLLSELTPEEAAEVNGGGFWLLSTLAVTAINGLKYGGEQIGEDWYQMLN